MSRKRKQSQFTKNNIKNGIRLVLSTGNLNTQLSTLIGIFCDKDNILQSDKKTSVFFSSLLKKSIRPIEKSLKDLAAKGFVEKINPYTIKINSSLVSKVAYSDYTIDEIKQDEEIELIYKRCMEYVPEYWVNIDSEKETMRAEISDLKTATGEMTTEISGMTTEISGMTTEISDLKNKIDNLIGILTPEQKKILPKLRLVLKK